MGGRQNLMVTPGETVNFAEYSLSSMLFRQHVHGPSYAGKVEWDRQVPAGEGLPLSYDPADAEPRPVS